MAKNRTVHEQTFVWDVKDILPPTFEKGQKYFSKPFVTTYGQSLKVQFSDWMDVLGVNVLIEKPFRLPIETAKFSVRFYLQGPGAQSVYCSAKLHEPVKDKVKDLLHVPYIGVYNFAKISKWDALRGLRLFLDISLETRRSVPDPRGELLRFIYESGPSDCCFIVENKRIRALKSILTRRSDYFRAMFHSGFKEGQDSEVELPGLSHDHVQTCFRWMYTGEVPDLFETPWPALKELYITADLFQLELTKAITDAIYYRHVTPSTFGEVFQLGQAHHDWKLMHKAMDVWGRHVVGGQRTDITPQTDILVDCLSDKKETVDTLKMALWFNENDTNSETDE
ncbi:Radial spoke head 14 [Quaeritorhiza haematococci]|nr:Radial spoke head 14 [Quaeritorhiza haematococci]